MCTAFRTGLSGPGTGLRSHFFAEGQTFELLSDGMTIRPAGVAEATVAQVMWVSPNELLLSSNRGPIQISYEGDTQTVQAGTSYRVFIQPDDSGPQDTGGHGNAGPVPAGHHNKIVLVSVLAVLAAVAGIATWRALLSPAGP